MIKAILAVGVCAAALCATPASPQAAEPVDPAPMTWPAMGFDPADLDAAARPGDDFFAYVNGKWDKATAIPPQYTDYGVSRDLELASERDLKEIVEQMAAQKAVKDSIEQKVGDAYHAFLDTGAIEARGMAAAQPYLRHIDAVGSLRDLAALFAAPGMPAPFGIDVHADEKNPGTNILNLWVTGYELPDRDNYLVDTPKNREMRAKYKDYLAFMLGKAGYADPAATAEAVYELEHKLAALDFDRTVSRNPELLYNVVRRSDLDAMAGPFPLQTYLDGLGVGGADTVIVDEMPPDRAKIAELGLKPDELAKLGGGMPAMLKLIGDTPLATWKAWAAAHFMASYAAYLPQEIDQRNFAFWGTYMEGQQAQRTRYKRALDVVEGQLGEAVGKLYVERYFPPESKAAMVDLVHNLLAAMGDEIDHNTWMSPPTKAAARNKLAAFTVKIGYPDKFKTYDGMEIVANDPIANAIAADEWEWNDTAKDLGQPVDKAKWYMTPQTVNAYYNPTGNEIVFPAAYLQPPNFALGADAAVNYGAIGATIGHEISHGFDNSGSKYDGTGKLANWWTRADRAKFDAKTAALAAQYDRYCPIDAGKTCINGKLTLGENIADLAGLTIAYRAYHMSLGGKPAPVIGGLTGDQRFFIAYAVSFRGKWTEELMREVLQTDPHSPDKARVNLVLQNFDPWYAAFGVKPGDKMYLASAKRVHIY